MHFVLLAILILFSGNSYAAYTCSRANAASNKCRHLVKHNASSGLGKCLPKGAPANIPQLFARNNINVFTGIVHKKARPSSKLSGLRDINDPRVVALARVVEALDQIGGGAMKALKNGGKIDVVFARNQANNSRRHGSQIQIAEGDQNMTGTLHASTCGGQDNHGLLAHELGHYIAGNNNQRVLNEYKKYMKGNRCRLTSYTTKNIGEEIAEVIAAYITLPDRFRNQGDSCNRAFDFMKELFNEPRMTMTCEARKKSYRRIRSAENIEVNPASRGTSVL